MAKKTTPTGKFDKNAVRKLHARKAVNAVERSERQDAGNDSKHTRDGGSKRRNWR